MSAVAALWMLELFGPRRWIVKASGERLKVLARRERLWGEGHSSPEKWVRYTPKSCILTCLIVSAMYLICNTSVVFEAFRRLVSLCIVYVSSVHSHVSFLCLVPSFMLLY